MFVSYVSEDILQTEADVKNVRNLQNVLPVNQKILTSVPLVMMGIILMEESVKPARIQTAQNVLMEPTYVKNIGPPQNKLPSSQATEQFYLLSVTKAVKHVQKQIQTTVLHVMPDFPSKVETVCLVTSPAKLVPATINQSAFLATVLPS